MTSSSSIHCTEGERQYKDKLKQNNKCQMSHAVKQMHCILMKIKYQSTSQSTPQFISH